MVLKTYFPEIEPYDEDTLRVSDIHKIHYEQCGNPDGKPILFLHGGPGSGSSPKLRRFADPDFYRIILFDQRGSGKSIPHAGLEENTTDHLVEDIEKLREHLGIDKWPIFGGSWGSTLALAYSVKHRERVKGLILRGIFLCRKEEISWFYEQGGAHMIFPEAWEGYLSQISGVKPGNMVSAYYDLLTGHDEEAKLKAAHAWSKWEAKTSKLEEDLELVEKFEDPKLATAFARIECHYFINNIFMPSDNYLVEETKKLKGIPTRIVQGRYDIICPIRTAWDLKKSMELPDKDFRVTLAGHGATEEKTLDQLIEATEDMKTGL